MKNKIMSTLKQRGTAAGWLPCSSIRTAAQFDAHFNLSGKTQDDSSRPAEERSRDAFDQWKKVSGQRILGLLCVTSNEKFHRFFRESTTSGAGLHTVW